MKISAIDVGSNSVRLAMIADGKTLYKRIATTRLGEGLALSGELTPKAIARTAQAIATFVGDAKKENSGRVYVFATAAVRSASNKREFLKSVKNLCGVDVDVVSGEEEALSAARTAVSSTSAAPAPRSPSKKTDKSSIPTAPI